MKYTKDQLYDRLNYYKYNNVKELLNNCENDANLEDMVIKRYWGTIELLKEKEEYCIDYDYIDKGIEINPNIYIFGSNEIKKDTTMLKKVLNKNLLMIEYTDNENKNNIDILNYIFSKQKYILNNVKLYDVLKHINKELIKQCIRNKVIDILFLIHNDFRNIYYIDDHNFLLNILNDKMFKQKLNNGMICGYINKEIISDKIIETLIKKNINLENVIKLINIDDLNNELYMYNKICINHKIFIYCSENLKNNYKFLNKCIYQNDKIINLLNDKILRNREFIIKLIIQDIKRFKIGEIYVRYKNDISIKKIMYDISLNKTCDILNLKSGLFLYEYKYKFWSKANHKMFKNIYNNYIYFLLWVKKQKKYGDWWYYVIKHCITPY